ncbi:hypothetical protein T5B8_02760 [Salinisphaera sp. T5B8]|uniref:DUF5666 domain-containing protein n=1 Tax=Salinisphaera sp. T5B8 TaxID=1304154 RepID=UPI003340C796
MMTALDNAGLTKRALAALLVSLLALLTVAGCGSDGGNDGGGQQAGIEGTGIVSGFGSVYIDGVEFETDAAQIVFVGEPVTESRLSPGDLVTVVGTVDAAGQARATRIVYERTLDGPIDQIETDGDTGTLVALGQTVEFDSDTVFVNAPAEELAAGDLIAVSGFTQTDNRVHAQSIRRSETGFVPNNSTLEIEGTVDSIEATRLRVGDQTIDFANAQIRPDRSALVVGSRIEAFGTRAESPDAPMIASRLNVSVFKQPPAGRQMLVGAQIRDYVDQSDFVAGGWRMDADDAQRLDNLASELSNGMYISARGVFENGRVKARTVRVEPPANAMLKADIDTIDTTAGTITLLGRRIDVRDDTRYIERRENGDRSLRIGTLVRGDTIRVQLYIDADKATVRSLERLPAGTSNAAVSGQVMQFERNDNTATIVVAGVTAELADDTTVYRDTEGDEIDADSFFARVENGRRVRLSGPQNGERISIVRSARLLRDTSK